MLENMFGQARQAVDPNQQRQQGLLPQNQQVPEAQPQEAPQQSVGLDVEKNPQDRQMMTDSIAHMLTLKQMKEEDRKEAWPQMVEKLNQVSPKASQLFDPSLPPTDKYLDKMLSNLPQGGEAKQADLSDYDRQAYLEAQTKRQMQGQDVQTPQDYVKEMESMKVQEDKPAKVSIDGQSPKEWLNDQENLNLQEKPIDKMSDDEIMKEAIYRAKGEASAKKAGLLLDDDKSEDPGKLTTPSKNEVQKKLINVQEDLHKMSDIVKNWNPDQFTYGSQIKSKYLDVKSKIMGEKGLSPEDVKFMEQRRKLKQNVMQMALLYRKYITGVAGGEKEMKDIISNTLNMDLNPVDARTARNELIKNMVRDQIVYSRLLRNGVQPIKKDDPAYTKKFLEERKKVQDTMNKFINDFVNHPDNKGATKKDAMMYYAKKMQAQGQ